MKTFREYFEKVFTYVMYEPRRKNTYNQDSGLKSLRLKANKKKTLREAIEYYIRNNLGERFVTNKMIKEIEKNIINILPKDSEEYQIDIERDFKIRNIIRKQIIEYKLNNQWKNVNI